VLFVTFVVKLFFSSLVAASPRWVLRGEYSSTVNPGQPKRRTRSRVYSDSTPHMIPRRQSIRLSFALYIS
jgi:hypothetical protein